MGGQRQTEGQAGVMVWVQAGKSDTEGELPKCSSW